MKKLLVMLSIVVLSSLLIFAIKPSHIKPKPVKSKQLQPKLFKFEFTEADVINLFNAVDNSSQTGEVRKPLLQKIQVQYSAQLQPDTIKHKK